MTGSILWMDEGSPCRWRLAKAGGRRDGAAGRIADILFGDFDRARAEAAVRELRRSLPANEILIVRSGCEALEFLRQRGLRPNPERPSRPLLALLDEDLSGMAGHSILRSMLSIPSLGEVLLIILVGTGRIAAHRQWSPDPDGYIEKPFSVFKLRDCIRSLGESAVPARMDQVESPA